MVHKHEPARDDAVNETTCIKLLAKIFMHFRAVRLHYVVLRAGNLGAHRCTSNAHGFQGACPNGIPTAATSGPVQIIAHARLHRHSKTRRSKGLREY